MSLLSLRIFTAAVLRRLLLLLLFASTAVACSERWDSPGRACLEHKARGKRNVDDVMQCIAPHAKIVWQQGFAAAQANFPPQKLALLAFKEERELEVWAQQQPQDSWRHIKTYPILAASGTAGPKLRQGDRQVPEGLYRLTWLHPNSSYHLSMKVDYPNEFDRAQAQKDGRSNLGGDIFIHGKAASIGCIAIGDQAIEELFYLVQRTGVQNVEVIIAPNDMRQHAPPEIARTAWTKTLYADIQKKLRDFVQ